MLIPKPTITRQRVRRYTAAALLALAAVSGTVAAKETPKEPPVAYTGHGMLFNSEGEVIEPSLDFIVESQSWYQQNLLSQLSKEDQALFVDLEQAFVRPFDKADIKSIALKSQLLHWAASRQKGESVNRRTRGILQALNSAALHRTKQLDKHFKKDHELEGLQRELRETLDRFKPEKKEDGFVLFQATTNSGQAYINECAAAGVPIPPPINQIDPTGLTGWRNEGFIPASDNMLGGGPAQVRSYRDPMVPGMCYSLPRFTSSSLNTIGLDGVICMSETTSRVCFWDNQWTSPTTGMVESFTIGATEIVPIGVPTTPGGKYQAGGAELEFADGGECTDCHAGENPYIIHPESSLLTTPTGTPIQPWRDFHAPAGDLDNFSVNRYVPLVAASWHQNEISFDSTALPGACSGCHVKTVAGRLPHLSNDLTGYCGTVLRLAGLNTMPQFTPGSAVTDVNNLRSTYCNAPPNASVADTGDPHILTVDGTRYDFQSAGEFTMLRAEDAGFELQTRQTPVLTTFTPGANGHTGLASCPSLNTAVAMRIGKAVISYQPAEGALSSKEDLQLFVNGKVVPDDTFMILGSGHSLDYRGPGKKLFVNMADGSTVRVTPKYWSSQGYWYLNVHVDDTYARAGVMGLISKGDWLPRLPDGTSLGAKPASVFDRHDVLNQKFADAWRVDKNTSLFYYAPGTGTEDFTDPDWPAPPGGSCEKTALPGDVPFVEKPRWDLADEVCSQIENKAIREACFIDVTVMGEVDAAQVHIEEDRKK